MHSRFQPHTDFDWESIENYSFEKCSQPEQAETIFRRVFEWLMEGKDPMKVYWRVCAFCYAYIPELIGFNSARALAEKLNVKRCTIRLLSDDIQSICGAGGYPADSRLGPRKTPSQFVRRWGSTNCAFDHVKGINRICQWIAKVDPQWVKDNRSVIRRDFQPLLKWVKENLADE